MQISALIEDFYDAEMTLRDVIQEDGSLTRLSECDQRSQECLQAIKEYQPGEYKELREKLHFFIGRLKADISNVSDAYSVDALVHMLEKDFPNPSAITDAITQDDSAVKRDENRFKLVNAYDLVSKSHDRISIIDRNYRYINTSDRNGDFYGLESRSIVGEHVGAVIGEQRFENRAKRFFNSCFSGSKQDYFHSLTVDGEERIMSCQMMPLYCDDSSVFGSLVAMNDVTDMVTDPSSILLQEVNEPGETRCC